jgi:hypothetical protein
MLGRRDHHCRLPRVNAHGKRPVIGSRSSASDVDLKMQTVLLSVTQMSQLPTALEISDQLDRGGYRSVLVSNVEDTTLQNRMSALSAVRGREFICLANLAPPHRSFDRISLWFEWKLIRYGIKQTERAPFKGLAKNYKRRIAIAGSLILEKAVTAVIVFEDNLSTDRMLLRAAQTRGIPVIDYPYEISGEEDFERDIAEKFVRGDAILVSKDAFGQLIRANFPHWIRATPRGDVLPFAGAVAAAFEETRISPPTPWLVHSGSADCLIADSDHFADLYALSGVPATKIRTIGNVFGDIVLAQVNKDPSRRNAFDAASKLNLEKTEVLLSLPPSYHGTRAAFAEFPSYADTLAALSESISGIDNLVVRASVHPNTLDEDAKIYENYFEICSRSVIDEISRHDLYVTCQSSTIRWAICARKPVINWDMYQFDVTVWDQCPGVLKVESMRECVVQIARLRDPQVYQHYARLQAQDTPKWALLDGRSSERFLRVLRELCPKMTSPPRALVAIGSSGALENVSKR